MSEEIEPIDEKKKTNGFLSEASTKKIVAWLVQINAKKRIRLSQKAFVNWYLESAPDNLSTNEINAIIEVFYDPEAHLRQMLREVQKAKMAGYHNNSLEVVVRERKTVEQKKLIDASYQPSANNSKSDSATESGESS